MQMQVMYDLLYQIVAYMKISMTFVLYQFGNFTKQINRQDKIFHTNIICLEASTGIKISTLLEKIGYSSINYKMDL